MFILYGLLLGLVAGVLVGGRLAGVAALHVRWAPLIVAGLLVQIVLFTDTVAAMVGDAGPVIYVGSTLLVLAAIVRNVAIPGMPLVVLGAISNLSAIVANGGYMPAAPGAMAALGKADPTIYSNSAVLASPALAPLTDVYALPAWLPWANIFSLGDVFIALGVALVIVLAMRRGRQSVAGGGRPPETAGAPAH